nr:hypothetical protein [Haliscomenobacter sp.]
MELPLFRKVGLMSFLWNRFLRNAWDLLDLPLRLTSPTPLSGFANSRETGTGLGLSLVYDIVTKGHGGTLEVVSTFQEPALKEAFVSIEQETGSVFLMTLAIKNT